MLPSLTSSFIRGAFSCFQFSECFQVTRLKKTPTNSGILASKQRVNNAGLHSNHFKCPDYCHKNQNCVNKSKRNRKKITFLVKKTGRLGARLVQEQKRRAVKPSLGSRAPKIIIEIVDGGLPRIVVEFEDPLFMHRQNSWEDRCLLPWPSRCSPPLYQC